jgi:hypothetical protein
VRQRIAHALRHRVPGRRHPAHGSHGADGIEAEIEGEVGERVAAPLGQRQHQRAHLAAMHARIDTQVDEIEHHAAQRPIEVLDRVDRHAKPARRRSLVGNEGQRIGTAFEIGNRQLIGLCRIGMIHTLRDAPAAGLLARNRRGFLRLRIERLNGDAVMAAGDELLLEVGALQHALDQLEPLLAGRLRKIGGEREIVHDGGLVRRKAARIARDNTGTRGRWECPKGWVRNVAPMGVITGLVPAIPGSAAQPRDDRP